MKKEIKMKASKYTIEYDPAKTVGLSYQKIW